MPTLNIGGQRVTVGDEFMKLSPEQQNATVDEIAGKLPKPAASGRMAGVAGSEAPITAGGGMNDLLRSIPRGVLGGLASSGSALGQAAAHEMGQPEMAAEIPNQEQTTSALEQNVTGNLPKPEGRMGRIGAAIGEGIGNPSSYVGPGSLPLKVGGAILSSAGSEGAGQATEGTRAEAPSRLIGALMGGMTAAKALGPTQAKAAIPTPEELKQAGRTGGMYGGYKGATQSGLELDPKGPASWAGNVAQDLYGRNFSGGEYGTARKTFGILDELQNPPSSATVTPAGLDAVKEKLKAVAKEVQATQGGAMVPTKDAAAASIALDHLKDYTEGGLLPHVVAGDAPAYIRATKEANANYGAGLRTGDFDARLTKAERATDRQIAGSLDQQIKSKAGQMLDRARGEDSNRIPGMVPSEVAQLELINSGTPTSNILRQLGRGGAGVVPLGMHLSAGIPAALMTGGATVAPQMALAGTLYGARKIAEAMTKKRASDLVDMLAKRSPEYEQRAAQIPTVDNSPNKAAILRAMISAAQ